jgi:hypothetical protein
MNSQDMADALRRASQEMSAQEFVVEFQIARAELEHAADSRYIIRDRKAAAMANAEMMIDEVAVGRYVVRYGPWERRDPADDPLRPNDRYAPITYRRRLFLYQHER